MIDCHHALKHYYPPEAQVYVGIDLMIYYVEGDPSVSVVPDVFVALGVVPGSRDTYRVWAEGKPPDFILEIASPDTAQHNAEGKKNQYRNIGVQEYWLYDPDGGLHQPRLQGFELTRGRYRRLEEKQQTAVDLAVRSKVLGLELHFDGERLRLWDPVERHYLLTPSEEGPARREAERQTREHAQARREFERQAAEEAQARREAERQAREHAQARREAERQAAEEAQARREAERQAAEEAQARREAERQAAEEAQARQDIERRARLAERTLAVFQEASISRPD